MALPIGHLERVRALALSGRMLLLGGTRAHAGSALHVYDLVDGKPVHTVELPCHVHGLATTPAGVAAACADGAIRLVDVQAGTVTATIPAHEGAILALAASPDGIVSVGHDGAVRTFATDGRRLAEHRVSSAPLRSVAVELTSGAIAVGGEDGVIRVLPRGGTPREMPGHDGPVLALAFTPAGDRLLSGGDDGTLRIWYLVGPVESDVRGSGETGHAGGAFAVVFLPGSTEVGAERFASAGADGKVRVWRLSDKRRPKTLDAGSAPLRALVFREDDRQGGTLLVAGDDRRVRGFAFTAEGASDARPAVWNHGFDVFEEALKSRAQPAPGGGRADARRRAQARRSSTALRGLAGDGDAGAHRRGEARRSRPPGRGRGLRARPTTRRPPPPSTLRSLRSDTPLSPLRAALRANAADMRRAAVQALPPLASTSPLVAGLVFERLGDADASGAPRGLRRGGGASSRRAAPCRCGRRSSAARPTSAPKPSPTSRPTAARPRRRWRRPWRAPSTTATASSAGWRSPRSC
ncbi:MAG: hypothetical protein R3F59_21085 [Myxococcota bacterium]